ncbi:MAG: VWA domain-containing protein [Polyangiales bacterium]
MRPAARLLGLLVLAACAKRKEARVVTTCGEVTVLHAGASADGAALTTDARLRCEATLQTDRDGRAIVRTDDGVELRLAGDTTVAMRDGRARVLRGKVFASTWGDADRALLVGEALTLGVRDAAVEIERDGARARVIVVRGEASYRLGGSQGQIAQGESLEGGAAMSLRPAPVWDDWTGGAASPRGAAPRAPRGVASANAHTAAGEAPTPLAMNLWRGAVSLRGDLAVTTLEQRFFNGAEHASPVEYSIRLPEGAIVSSFALERSGSWQRATPGVVAAASSAGTTALHVDGDGGLRASLGILAPGETVGARITFAQWLTRDGATRRYSLPLGDAQSPEIIGEFSFDMDLEGAAASEVRLPAGARLANGHVQLRRSDWRPRADLSVELVDLARFDRAVARAWLPAYSPRGARRVTMLDVALPATPAVGTDFAVVVDESAATSPASLEVARAAVDALLRQLGSNDRVALLLGDLGARPAEPSLGRLLAVDAARRERILDAVSRARPGGASDLGRMLVEAHATLDARRNGVVLYLGDGAPTVGTLDPARLAEEVRRQAPDLRLLGVAVGRGAHDEVLRAIAGAAGEVARVEDPAEAVASVSALAARATQPCLREVRVRLGEGQQTLPEVLGAVRVTDALRVFAELEDGKEPPSELVVEAREAGAARRWRFPVRVSKVRDEGDIARRWATARVAQLESTGAGRASIADIGARYGLLTPASALLVGIAPVTLGSGWTISASPWPVDEGARALPSLGVTERGPRGVQTLGVLAEAPIALDDGDGWRAHSTREPGPGSPGATLSAALASADPAARACVVRKRALRPGLAGRIVIDAQVDAAGRVTAASVRSSSLGDVETDACVRRAVEGLTLPAPELLGAQPGHAERAFEFAPAPAGSGYAARVCPRSARLSRAMRRALWRERLNARGLSADSAAAVWREAEQRCELRWWEDRVALLDLVLERVPDPAQLARFRDGLDDATSAEWLDGALARRFGASSAWRALHRTPYVDWGALLTRLASPALTPEGRVSLLRAWLSVAPRDLDLRLRLLDALEAAGREREGRALAEALRRDPLADARVRGRVGEFLLRAGDRREALRALTEIVEFAPYDPWARTRLGDLLLSAGDASLAHRQYQTLALLDTGDASATARLGVAALAASREDEGLRALRLALEQAGDGAAGRDLRALLAVEVARVASARRDDPAARAWARTGRQLGGPGSSTLVLRWTHPDLGAELLLQRAGEAAATVVGDASSTLGLRVVTLDDDAEGARIVVRGASGLEGARRVEVTVARLSGATLVERRIRLDAARRAEALTLQADAFAHAELRAGEAPGSPSE